ncbi:hypothetical protein M9Y10_007593 [Tritrichomonas musculus]|uniref:Uncharacterized protein n=1 Tax=Tritrichomonas musculus TaxID=1915356 RepID=A0ABR2J1W0_9EUKA
MMIFTLLYILTSAKTYESSDLLNNKNIALLEEHANISVLITCTNSNIKGFRYEIKDKDHVRKSGDLLYFPNAGSTPGKNIIFGILPDETVLFYVNTNGCKNLYLYSTTIYASDLGKTLEKEIKERDITPMCLKTPVPYYIAIKNDLPGKYGSKLFVDSSVTGESNEVALGKIYNESHSGVQTFTVSIYYKTDICSTEEMFLKSLEATTEEEIISININNISDECIPYEVCMSLNGIPDGYKIGYTNETDQTPVVITNTVFSLVSEKEFKVQLYIIEAPDSTKCPANTKIGEEYSSQKKFQCVNVAIPTLIPTDCKVCDASSLENCAACTFSDDDKKICTKCSNDDYAIGFGEEKCISCNTIEHCATCQTGTDSKNPIKCLTCEEKYELKDGSCVITEFEYKYLIENINDILNDGINKDIFDKAFKPFDGFDKNYEKITNYLANTSLSIYELLHREIDEKYSPFFDTSKSLYDLIPDIKEFFTSEKTKALFVMVNKIVSEIGPDLSSALSLDYSTINQIYNYVVNNDKNGNDGIKITKILEIIGLKTDILPKVQKILSNFEESVPITTLFEALDSKTQYDDFIKKAQELTISEKDNSKKFFSISKIYDTVSSGIDLIRAINSNFVQKYTNELIMPVVTKYGLKPINIFNPSINERASSILKALNTIKGYRNTCPRDEETEPELKCVLYESIRRFSENVWCVDDDDEKCAENAFSSLQSKIQKFTNEKVNLIEILTKEFMVPPNTAKFIFVLMADLTDSKKNYLDLIQDFALIYNEDDKGSFWIYKDQPIHTIIENITNAVKFVSSIEVNSNFRLLFDYLNIPQYWEVISNYVQKIDKNELLCKIIEEEPEEEYCNELAQQIKDISEKLISEEVTVNDFLEGVLEGFSSILTNIGIPALKNLDKKIDQFLSKGFKAAAPGLNEILGLQINENNEVKFDSIVTKGGNLFDKIISFVDESIPSAVKMLPIVGDLYPQLISKSRGFIKVIKDNGELTSLLNSCYDGIGVIVQMLANAANAYKDVKTQMAAFVKGAQPTSFLNIYSTAEAVNKLKDGYGIKDLIESIKYDGSKARLLETKITINDVVPVQTISEKSKDLSKGFQEGNLQMKTVAEGLGVEPSELKKSLSSAVSSIVSPPAEVVKEVAKATGADTKYIDDVIEKINDMSKNPENVNTNARVDPNSKKKGGLSAGAIAGIVIGCVVAVGVAVFLGVYFGIIRKKKNESSDKQAGDEGDGKNDDL